MITNGLDFSIITPVYNGDKYLEETLNSVFTYTKDIKYEHIVVNDGSNDKTTEILEKYQNKIVIINQLNAGQASAINRGLHAASGRYSMILNSDDPLITNELFESSRTILDKNLDVVLTYPDWQIIDYQNKVIRTKHQREFSIIEFFGHSNCLVGPGGIFRTQTALKIGGWNSDYRFVPDYDFWLRLLAFGKFVHVPKVQAAWRNHQGSISIKFRGKEMADERIRVIEDHIFRNQSLDIKLINIARAFAYQNAARLSYFTNAVKGRQLLWKSFLLYPKIIVKQDFRITLFILLLPFSRMLLKSGKQLFSVLSRY